MSVDGKMLDLVRFRQRQWQVIRHTMKLISYLCIFILCFWRGQTDAQDVTSKDHRPFQAVTPSEDGIRRLTAPLALDGRMGDPGWKSAAVYADFKMRHPEAGKSPSERTELYLAYDATTLYVATRSFDHEPKKIRALATTADEAWKDDWAVLCLNTYDDALPGLFFLVTPKNVQSAGTLDIENKPNLALNLKWESRAAVVDDGWIAEMAIPLRSLAFHGSDRVTMSFKLARFISRKDEEESFPEMNPDELETEHYRPIILRNVLRPSVSYSELNREGLENLKLNRLRLQHLPQQEQLDHWHGASVFDYLVFPSRELAASPHPFHFKRTADGARVADLLAPMEYAPGKRIEDLPRFLTRSATTSFIVIKNDAILYESYFNGYQRDSLATSFSVAKSFDSALVGVAIEERKIGGVEDPITQYLPELSKRDPKFASITIRNLLQMSAGIRYSEDPPYRDDDVTYLGADLRAAALESTAVIDPPGKYFVYNDYHPLLIGLALERTAGQSVTQYFQEKLWGRLGMEYPGSWSTDFEQPPFEKMLVGINARPIDFAKFGRLMLNGGRWDGSQILSEQWVQESTQDEAKPPGYYREDTEFFARGHYYKYFWWGDKRPGGKSDFHAAGNKGQYIYVSPQKNVIIVRTGFDYGIPPSRWFRLFYQLADGL